MAQWVTLPGTVNSGDQARAMISMVSPPHRAATRLTRSTSPSWLSWVMLPLAPHLLHLAPGLLQVEPCQLVLAHSVDSRRHPEHCHLHHLVAQVAGVVRVVTIVGAMVVARVASSSGEEVVSSNGVARVVDRRMGVVRTGTIHLLRHLVRVDHNKDMVATVHLPPLGPRGPAVMAVARAGVSISGVPQVVPLLHLVAHHLSLLHTGDKVGDNSSQEGDKATSSPISSEPLLHHRLQVNQLDLQQKIEQ